MQFHTCAGIPITDVPSDTLQALLVDGFEIDRNDDGHPNPEKSVRAQIEIVLLARSLGYLA